MPFLHERRGATLIHSRVPLRQMRVCNLPRSIQYRTEASPVLHKHVKCHAQRNIPLSLEADEETSELRPVKHPRGDWDRRDWARPYEDNLRECKEATIVSIRGVLPRSVCGTYFRNGPGVFFKGGSDPFSRIRVAHPFDGDGAVLSIKFNGSDQAKFRIRFVQTAEYVAEQRSKRWMSRGTFGTNICGGLSANMLDVSPRNAANISVMAVNGRVFALFEGGQPHELDPETLQTLGITTFNGLLKVGAPFNMDWIGLSGTAGRILSTVRKARGLEPSTVTLGGDSFASHFRRDPRRNRIGELHGNTTGFQTYLRFYEMSDDMEVLTVQNYDLPGYAFIHDFAITEDSIVLLVNASSLHLRDFILGKKGIIHCIHYDEKKPLKVVVIPRKLSAADGGAADTAEHVFGWTAQTKTPEQRMHPATDEIA